MRVTFGFYQHIFPLGADGLSGGSPMVAARYLVVLLDILFLGPTRTSGNISDVLAEIERNARRCWTALRLPINVRVFKVPVVKTSSPDELAAGHPMQKPTQRPLPDRSIRRSVTQFFLAAAATKTRSTGVAALMIIKVNGKIVCCCR